MTERLDIGCVRHLVTDAYIPFAEEEREILWPGTERRWENDAEHSFSLALVGMALGQELGMDAAKICYYATVHDLPELITGDVSVWDDEGRKTKHEREQAAIQELDLKFKQTPILKLAVEQYEARQDEEANFVYALDKLLALLVIVEGGGAFWRRKGVTFEMHLAKVEEVKPRVAVHPEVASWYAELLDEVERRREELFSN